MSVVPMRSSVRQTSISESAKVQMGIVERSAPTQQQQMRQMLRTASALVVKPDCVPANVIHRQIALVDLPAMRCHNSPFSSPPVEQASAFPSPGIDAKALQIAACQPAVPWQQLTLPVRCVPRPVETLMTVHQATHVTLTANLDLGSVDPRTNFFFSSGLPLLQTHRKLVRVLQSTK